MGSKSPSPKPAAAKAVETPQAVAQATRDDYRKRLEAMRRNQSVLAAANDAAFGQRLTLGDGGQ